VLFASNWAQDCGTGCGSASEVKDFVLRNQVAVGVGSPGAPAAGLALAEPRPNPCAHLPSVQYALAGAGAATLELIDVAGRRVLSEDLGAPGPGSYELSFGPRSSPGAGVYWLRLRQGGQTVTRSLVLTR
jgi:hypothetical protein